MSQKLQSVKGMNDLLPSSSHQWQEVEATLRTIANAYYYQEIRTPILEKTELFVHAIGEQTDIVEKEMYAFTDAGNENVCMRPENTAAVVRAGIQHGLFHNTQQRLWYLGPMFRRERPQKGRYRQFHQFGMETFGWAGPSIDAELLLIGARMWQQLGVNDVSLHLNTLGSPVARSHFREALVSYLAEHYDALDEDSKRRLERNPLRILDTKNPTTRAIIDQAPEMTSFLEPEDKTHFEGLCTLLDQAGLDYTIDPTLVRGLDYYTSTVFEWKTNQLGAQNTICAGGRYDELVSSRGGRATPACGFAMGLERLIELRALENELAANANLDVYLASLGQMAESKAMQLAEMLRSDGLSVALNCGGGKLTAQLKRADQSGARIALILGEDELAKNAIQVKYLRTSKADELVSLDAVSNLLNDQPE